MTRSQELLPMQIQEANLMITEVKSSRSHSSSALHPVFFQIKFKILSKCILLNGQPLFSNVGTDINGKLIILKCCQFVNYLHSSSQQ